MLKNLSTSKINTTFAGFLIIVSFVIGSLWTKVQYLEKGSSANKQVAGVQTAGQAVAQPNQPIATTAPVVKQDLKVANDDPVKGPKDAKVTIIEFADFQCPFCGAFSGLNQEVVKSMQSQNPSWQSAETNILKDYVDSGKARFVFKDYPFLGQESIWAAQAARCAQDQGKFWEYHDYLYSHQKGENQGTFSKDNLKKFASDLALATSDFNNCLDSGKYEKKMQDALTYGKGVGVSGTPSTFINGQMVSGAVPYSQFKTLIEQELKK